MEKIDLSALVEYVESARRQGHPLDKAMYSSQVDTESWFWQEAERLLSKQEDTWENLLRRLVSLRGAVQLSLVEMDHRPDVDIYYEDSEGIHHYILRNHTSTTPWRDAFMVLKEEQPIQEVDPSGGRIARIMNHGK